MKLHRPPVEVPPEDPWRNDAFGRRKFGDALTALIKNSRGGAVASLEAQWGDGKSTFIRMWRASLCRERIPVLFLDAFKLDFFADPFTAIAAEVNTFCADNGLNADRAEMVAAAKKAASLVGRAGLKIGLKALTLGALDADALRSLGELKEDIFKHQEDMLEAAFEDSLKAYKEAQSRLSGLGSILARIGAAQRERFAAPLIIIVDELDRCRPGYAVDFLETVKHFFVSDDVFFLLSINPAQLEEAIRSVHGEGVDATRYLGKFINLRLSLPKIKADRRKTVVEEYVSRLVSDYEVGKSEERPYIARLVTELVCWQNIPIREIDHVVTRAGLTLSAIPNNFIRPIDLVVFLAWVRHSHYPEYQLIASGEADLGALEKRLLVRSHEDENEQSMSVNMHDWLSMRLLSKAQRDGLPEARRKRLEMLAGHLSQTRSNGESVFNFVFTVMDNLLLT